jgi:hypothetical protein
MRKILLYFIVLFIVTSAYGQLSTIDNSLNKKIDINWLKPTTFKGFDDKDITLLQFDHASFNFPFDSLPLFNKTIYLPSSTNNVQVKIQIEASKPLSLKEQSALLNKNIPTSIESKSKVSWYRKKPIVTISFNPVYKDVNTNEVYKVTSFSYTIIPVIAERSSLSAQMNFKVNSVLRYGNWVKIGVFQDGIYQLTYNDLQSIGINVENLESDQIRLFGNGGGHLPFDNAKPRLDDLEENAIEIVDGGDGIINSGDYILFYGQNPHRWKYINGRFNHVVHLFSDTTYYFVTRDYEIGAPKRVNKQNITSTPDLTVNSFNDFQYHEVDLLNFIKSGRNWYGESFAFNKEQSFDFSFPNAIGSTAEIKSNMAFRVIGKSSTFAFDVNGTNILNISHPGISGGYYSDYAAIVTGRNNFNIPSDNFKVRIRFSNLSTADNGWLDYIEILCDRQLKMTGDQMLFRNKESANANIIQYNISGLSNNRIWNVTTPTEVSEVSIINNSFKSKGGEINEYVAFSNSNFLKAKNFGKVANQDLHSIQSADYVIVTHPEFINQANQLAEYHRNYSKLNTVVVTTQQLYNEFSSGSQDITAIKSFNKMLYDRAGNDPKKMLKYVLLLGDASYDYKNRLTANTNFVPAYQSWNSHSPLGSYVSDDYVGFLDDNESDQSLSTLDIGIGRIMANNTAQAQDVINKTIHYLSSPVCMRPWRNKLTFIGDDEDGNRYMDQSDILATKIDTTYSNYNINKIYLDAYQQVSNAGGSTYPDVNTAFDQATEKGSMIINYIGHGGELGLAHERILGLTQIKGYQNYDALALYVTATCEFSRFDDPERTSAGEFALLNPLGAALGLLTTTRLVYASPNFELAQKFFAVAFEQVDGEWPRLGDLLRISKVGASIDTYINYRNFSLLGDPAAQMAYPEFNIESISVPDTIKSLQKITISGMVTDHFGQKIENFNGIVYPTIYSQRKKQSTLNNDGNGVFEYETQNNLLFNGKATVKNGSFAFSFIVPKDINFKYGAGKISYYAENGTLDASGSDESFQIGGRDGNPDADNVGPTINLWMNDESFVMGGMTNENPLIYAKLFDENGINTVGNGIGHDIVAVIDENTVNSINLNDYYESELNSYQKGSISYNLNNLSEGKHTLRLKVWDVYNNSNEAVTEFYVSKSSTFNIDHVLNYPNPFTTNTDFYFDHNALGQQLNIRIQIFTISGKLVKTIDHIELSEGYRVGPINWNGRDEFGDRIGKGTYIYKVKVTNSFSQAVEKFEKIVIL